MRILLCLLLLLLALPASAEEPTVFIATDLHYIAPELTDHGEYFMSLIEDGDGKVTHLIDPLTDAFVAQVVSEAPDAIILSGDLTFNGARASHEALAGKLRQVTNAGIPVLVIPGNHDLNCTAAVRFEDDGYTRVATVTAEEFRAIYEDMGYVGALAADPASLSYMYELTPQWRLLMLDVNSGVLPGILTEETLAWVEEQLAQARQDGVRVLAVSHQNLFGHNTMFTAGFVMQGAARLAEVYADSPVQLNLSGHMHLQHTVTRDGLTEIAVSSLAVSPNQYGVLTLGDDAGHYASRTVDVAAWAAQTGQMDEVLLDFAAQSEAFFKDTARSQAMALVGNMDGGAEMADWFAALNAAYFAGRMDEAPADEELSLAWQQSGTFLGWYIASILMDPPADHTQLPLAWR